MHDLLEGVVPLTIKLVLQSFHQRGIVTVTQVNVELENFEFGCNDVKNKPTKIPLSLVRRDGHLSGKAIEKWCLFRILPFLIGSYVAQNDKHWKLFLILRELVDIVFAPSLTFDIFHYLELLINEFFECFRILFPQSFTPKLHYMVHYPNLIRKFGPLRAMWCLRFEGKHQYFKKLAGVVCNFKNICLTLGHRHQMRQCWQLSSTYTLETQQEQVGGKSVPFMSLTNTVRDHLRSICNLSTSEVNPKECVLKVRQLNLHSIKYQIKDFFIVKLLHEEQIPLFSKVLDIVNFRSQWLICSRLYRAVKYNDHLHAYSVVDAEDTLIFRAGEELDYHALDGYLNPDRNLYITYHHYPAEISRLT